MVFPFFLLLPFSRKCENIFCAYARQKNMHKRRIRNFMQIRATNAYVCAHKAAQICIESDLFVSVIHIAQTKSINFLSKFLIRFGCMHVWICSLIRWSRPNIMMAENSSYATLGIELTVSNFRFSTCVLQIYIFVIWVIQSTWRWLQVTNCDDNNNDTRERRGTFRYERTLHAYKSM